MLAITGATGFVGQALLDAAAGTEMRALTRSDQAAREGVEWVRGDLADRAALKRLVTGSEAVIHVAGVINAPDTAGFELGNVAGTLNVVEAAIAAGVQRIVLVSSLAAREPQLSDYGASKRRAERIVMASGLDWTIVRPPAVYGPRDREMLELFKLAKLGVVPMPPAGHASLLHVTDLAELLLDLVPSGEAVTHHMFEPDDGRKDGWSHRDLARAIGWAIGKRPWTPHLSQSTLQRLARLDRLVRGRNAKLTADRARYMSHPDWVARPDMHVPRAIWGPRVNTREGLRATAQWYRERGWL